MVEDTAYLYVADVFPERSRCGSNIDYCTIISFQMYTSNIGPHRGRAKFSFWHGKVGLEPHISTAVTMLRQERAVYKNMPELYCLRRPR